MKQYHFIISVICVFLTVMLIVSICSKKNNHVVVEQNTSLLRQHVIDSIVTEQTKLTIVREDSIQAIAEHKIMEAKETARYWEKIAKKRLHRAETQQQRADSLSELADSVCIEVITAYKAVNFELHESNEALTNANTALELESQYWCELSESQDVEIASLNQLLISKNNTISVQKVSISEYEKKLKKGWLERNSFWIGTAFGVFLGVAL